MYSNDFVFCIFFVFLLFCLIVYNVIRSALHYAMSIYNVILINKVNWCTTKTGHGPNCINSSINKMQLKKIKKMLGSHFFLGISLSQSIFLKDMTTFWLQQMIQSQQLTYPRELQLFFIFDLYVRCWNNIVCQQLRYMNILPVQMAFSLKKTSWGRRDVKVHQLRLLKAAEVGGWCHFRPIPIRWSSEGQQ